MPNINCNCGKLIAKMEGGHLLLWCKNCRKEITLDPKTEKDGTIIFVPKKTKK